AREPPDRDAQARDGPAPAPPAGPGRLSLRIAGALDDHERRPLSSLLELSPRRHVADGVGAEHEEELTAGPAERNEGVVRDRRLAPLDLDRRRLHPVALAGACPD